MVTPSVGVRTQVYLCRNCIGGGWKDSRGNAKMLLNPATGEPLTEIPDSTPEEVQGAIAAAGSAFELWRKRPVTERAKILFRYRELLSAHSEELARLVTLENGKTLDESRGSVLRGIEAVEFSCGIPSLMTGETLENVGRSVDTISIRQPLGVCAGIPPFNFPAMIPLWMFPLAVACGNTFVLKPSDKAPRTGVRLAELFYEAGFPGGVLNIVHGAKDAVDLILKDSRVKAISFVGSSPVAEYVYKTAAAHGKRVQALGGAKNHAVVMPDCDLQEAAKAIAAAAFGCAGERCLATSVVVTVGEVGDPLVRELVSLAEKIRVGSGDRAETNMGPVISADHRERILKYIEIGLKEGAQLARDGRQIVPHDGSKGFYVGPTVFDRVEPRMRIAREEIFGPVLSIIRMPTLDEATSLVNNASLGNASSIFTRSGKTARDFASRIETGMVGVNVGVPAPLAYFQFAGWKGSFYGDLHALGRDSIEFYTEKKLVTSRWSSGRC